MQKLPLCVLFIFLFGNACSSADTPTAPDEARLPVGPRPADGEAIPNPAAWRSGAEIQAAIDGAEPGATIQLDPDVYLIAQEISIRVPLTLRGQPGTTLVLSGTARSSVIGLFGSATSPVHGVRLEQLRIFGRGPTHRAGAGVALVNVRDCTLADLTISNCYLDGVYASGAIGCRFENLTLRENGRHGLAFGEASARPSEANRLLRCRADANRLHGFDGEPVVNTRFEECEAADNLEDGFSLGAGSRSHDNLLLGCRSHHNGRFGMMLWADSNRVEGCESSANAMAGIHVAGPAASNNAIIRCAFLANGWHGISLDRTTKTLVDSNRVDDNAQAGTGDGIAVVASIPVHGNSVIGNRSSGRRQRYSLVVTALALETVLADNLLDGPVSIAPEAVAR
jgi:parallel beta-helix repeat protein